MENKMENNELELNVLKLKAEVYDLNKLHKDTVEEYKTGINSRDKFISDIARVIYGDMLPESLPFEVMLNDIRDKMERLEQLEYLSTVKYEVGQAEEGVFEEIPLIEESKDEVLEDDYPQPLPEQGTEGDAHPEN